MYVYNVTILVKKIETIVLSKKRYFKDEDNPKIIYKPISFEIIELKRGNYIDG